LCCQPKGRIKIEDVKEWGAKRIFGYRDEEVKDNIKYGIMGIMIFTFH
jgi:hypothetical protein